MSAPPRVIYIDKFSVVDCLKDIGGDWEYILKSDYDELQAKLTEAECQRDSAIDSLRWIHNSSKTGASIDVICGYAKGAIREIEGALK